MFGDIVMLREANALFQVQKAALCILWRQISAHSLLMAGRRNRRDFEGEHPEACLEKTSTFDFSKTYDVMGPEQSETVIVLVHGAGGNRAMFRPRRLSYPISLGTAAYRTPNSPWTHARR